MIDEEASKAIVRQMHQHWIGPELDARAKAGSLPQDFRITRSLIRLPKNGKPIVEFNEEVSLSARVKVPDDCEPTAGDTACLDNIEYVDRVYPPEVDGVRVAFFYAQWVGGKYAVFFDLTPNHDDFPVQPADGWDMGKSIGLAVHGSMVELAIAMHESVQADLTKIGLWAAPALLPYPLSKIVGLVKAGDEAGARTVLVGHCTAERLSEMVTAWWGVPAFDVRRILFEQAMSAHLAGHYCLSISTLIPHLEGVLTDWLHSTVPDPKWRQDSKTRQFRDVIASYLDATPTYRRVMESAVGFILDGPALADFTSWYASFDTSFANRHVVGHGRFDPAVYSEENSVKLFLMLDTLRQLISGYVAKPAPPGHRDIEGEPPILFRSTTG